MSASVSVCMCVCVCVCVHAWEATKKHTSLPREMLKQGWASAAFIRQSQHPGEWVLRHFPSHQLLM